MVARDDDVRHRKNVLRVCLGDFPELHSLSARIADRDCHANRSKNYMLVNKRHPHSGELKLCIVRRRLGIMYGLVTVTTWTGREIIKFSDEASSACSRVLQNGIGRYRCRGARKSPS